MPATGEELDETLVCLHARLEVLEEQLPEFPEETEPPDSADA